MYMFGLISTQKRPKSAKAVVIVNFKLKRGTLTGVSGAQGFVW
jgi:hypothetical protein